MTWIADVVTRTVIRSVWGNAIRDHVVHTFDTVAEMKAPPVVAKQGMRAYVAATLSLYLYDGTGWAITDEPWQTWPTPRIYSSANGNLDWTQRASPLGTHLQLTAAPYSFLNYRRTYRTVDVVGSYQFIQPTPPGEAVGICMAEVPIATVYPVQLHVGTGGGYGASSANGEMGGPAYLSGNAMFAVRAGSGNTINIAPSGTVAYPAANDRFYISGRYQTNPQYA